MTVPALAAAFFVTALLYAAVGFGGGSTYNALLALSGVDYRVLPVIALTCNIIVVAGSTIRFARAGITPWRKALLVTGLAAPAAFIGGTIPVAKDVFVALLGLSLLFAGGALLLQPAEAGQEPASRHAWLVPAAAVPIGLLAGITGIGGGIFLAPLLHLVRWAETKAVAATASLFILVNSVAGLAGQLAKGGPDRMTAAVTFGLPLMLAVAVGGQIGSLLLTKRLPPRWVRWGTAGLTIYAGGRLLST